MKATKTTKKRMKPSVFMKKYGRIIFGAMILSVIFFLAIFADVVCEQDPYYISLKDKHVAYDENHILGTDLMGRDIFARLCHGAQNTLIVAIGTVAFQVTVGAITGVACGYYYKLEMVLMRILEAYGMIPNLLLLMMMASIFGNGIPNMILALGVGGIGGIAKTVRNQVLSLKQKEFVESAKAMGAKDTRIMYIHILPQLTSYLTVRFSSGLAGNVLSMTSLSYLGVGLDPMLASWGGMVSDGQLFLFSTPHEVLWPGVAISLTVFGFTLMGDGIRDLLDPRLR